MRARTLLPSLALLLAAPRAFADVPLPAGHVPVPGRPLATNDDASSIAQNPANLGFVPAPELRWTWVSSTKDSQVANRGHAFDLALPLGGLALGARLDFLRPHEDYRHHWVTYALSLTPSDAFSLGFTYGKSYASTGPLGGMTAATTAMSIRPSKYFGLAGVLRGFNDDPRYGRAYELGAAIRPLGTRAFEIGLEGIAQKGRDQWIPRGVVGVDVPWVGRLRGDVAFLDPKSDDRKWMASVGLDLNSIGSQTFGGALIGNAYGGTGFYAGLAVRGYGEPGFPGSMGEVVKVRLEQTPGNRGHVALLRRLWALAESDAVTAVVFQLKADPASSSAHGEELGDAIRMLRSRGKKVVCHLEDAGARSLHVCSQADRVVMNPAGGLRFAGMRAQFTYYGAALAKLGVRAEFVRIGKHKTAAESFAAAGPSEEAEEDHKDMLHEVEDVLISDVGGGRKISKDELRSRIAKGPFVAKEALAAGLVDGYAYDDELGLVVRELYPNAYRTPYLTDLKSSSVFMDRAPAEMGERDRLGVVYVEGDMIDGRSRDVPLLGNKLAGGYTIAEAIDALRKDSRVKAIVLRVETPGGSSMAADVIWRAVEKAKAEKPVVVSMGSTAASGGYYISAPASVIFANRGTLTGSIGIFYGKVDVSELTKQLGVNVVTYRTAPRADAESIYRPFTDDERTELGRKVKSFYDTFVDRVSRGRHMTADEVDAVARGHVWSGRQAKERKLVDQIGGMREAMAEARRLGGLSPDAPIVELPRVPTNLLGLVLGMAGASSKEADEGGLPIPPAILSLARGLYPFTVHPEGTPLARLPFDADIP